MNPNAIPNIPFRDRKPPQRDSFDESSISLETPCSQSELVSISEDIICPSRY
ncbi:unnamed protein product [Hymenolepis diminuta]|uniref:Uncharacterized protein n=1 Tax=Hymenolepis diminuta TaxID=6216 RepID=A0A564Y9F9_HYMDI|nr:unnamed protein product [Hymenolepis diminuta]